MPTSVTLRSDCGLSFHIKMMIGIRRRNPLIFGIVRRQGFFGLMELDCVFRFLEFVSRVLLALVLIARDPEGVLSGGAGEIGLRNSRHAIDRHRI